MSMKLRYCLYLYDRLERAERLYKHIKKRLNRSLDQLDDNDTIYFGYKTGHLEQEDYDKWLKKLKRKL